MAKGILVHRADSKYDDFPEERYQFPKRYLNRARQFIGDWIAFYEPRGGGGRMGYTAIARIGEIREDPGAKDMYVANIEAGSYLPLEKFVPLRKESNFIEGDLQKLDGSLNQGLIQWAIRPISDQDFLHLLERGYPETPDKLPRIGEITRAPQAALGFAEDIAPYTAQRTPVERTISLIPRDRVFRKIVLEAYEETCALTGLKLLNGGGRAEVEAAHVRPVAQDGPDTIRNGISLSGTVHWMFDRGLISLTDNLDILVSRHANNPNQIWGLLNPSRKAQTPKNPLCRPHPRYLNWHREHCFKH